MLLIKAPDYRGQRAEAVNTLVCRLEGASGPALPRSQGTNVPTDGLAGSDLMVNRARSPCVTAEGSELLLAKLCTTSVPISQFCERNICSHMVNAQRLR